MAQMKRPGDDRDEVTGAYTPESIRKKQEREVSEQREPEKEDSPLVRKALRFIDFREIVKLKKFLQEQGGEVAALSSETKKKIGVINPYKHVWDSEDLRDFIVDCVRKGDFLGAFEFVENNEQFIMEAWVDDYLTKKRYQEAATTLRDFAKIKPSKTMDEEAMKLEEEIDEDIMAAVDEKLKEKKEQQFYPAHDRVWSLVHNGFFLQAAELCDKLNVHEYSGETLEEAREKRREKQRDTVPSPMKFAETAEEVEKRHEAELLRALPKTAEEMKTVFKDLPELISHYHHLARVDENDSLYIDALKGSFELFANRLFEEKKVVIEEKGLVPVQEELLGIIDDLGYLGFHLFINHRSNENKLYLMADYEADMDYFTPVDLNSLSPRDIVIDEENFVEQMPTTLRLDEEKTLTGEETTVRREPNRYTWVSKVITVKPEKAHELRWAA